MLACSLFLYCGFGSRFLTEVQVFFDGLFVADIVPYTAVRLANVYKGREVIKRSENNSLANKFANKTCLHRELDKFRNRFLVSMEPFCWIEYGCFFESNNPGQSSPRRLTKFANNIYSHWLCGTLMNRFRCQDLQLLTVGKWKGFLCPRILFITPYRKITHFWLVRK